MLNYNLIQSNSNVLAVLIHGRAGNISVMSIFKNSIPKDWNILFIEAPLEDPIGGFSWWIKDAEIKSPEIKEDQIGNSLQKLEETLLHVENNLPNIISKRVGLGFSQGGAILSLLVQKRPRLFSKIALLSSFALNFPTNSESLSSLSVLVSHGEKDEVVTLEQNRESIKNLRDKGARIEEVLDHTGHKLGKNGMKRLKNWIIE
jgi:predicted esterase